MYKREYWQSVRGGCILSVVLIYALGGFDYSAGYDTEFIILRQLINFAVAIFIFMAGYFVPVEKIVQSGNWYLYWCLKFVLTFALSFCIVLIGQNMFKNKKNILKCIGFV